MIANSDVMVMKFLAKNRIGGNVGMITAELTGKIDLLPQESYDKVEDFMYQLFGIVTTSQDTLDYWGED